MVSNNDYYEILGVRPSAGRGEIELAYKGRRSQYHPDRYGQTDAETQAWATEKMQQVNEAYQALTSPELRARAEQGESERSAQSAPTRERAASAYGTQDAAAVLLKPEWEWFHDKVYARPNIPPRKLEGAISSYAPGVPPGEVIALLDDTLFGGAKEGLLVTNDAIYCKQKFEKPRRMAFNAIKQVKPGSDSRVIVNEQVFFKADVIDHLAILTFASRLSNVFTQATPANEERPTPTKKRERSGVDDLWILHRGAMAALRTEGKTFLVDELIDRQMRCIAERFSDLSQAVENKPRFGHTRGSLDAESAELALMLFLILHYYAFSQLPSAFKEAVGNDLIRFYEVSELYKAAFREGFPVIFGRTMETSQKDLLMMSLIFFNRDGAGGFELNLPREEALSRLFSGMGIQRETARELVCQFEGHAESWLDALFAPASG